MAGMVRQVEIWCAAFWKGQARRGKAGMVRLGDAGYGSVGSGTVRMVEAGKVCSG